MTELNATGPAGADPAVIRIVRGDPSAEQLAALLAVLASAGSEAPEPARAPESGWTDRSRYLRGALPHAPNGWRASAFPR